MGQNIASWADEQFIIAVRHINHLIDERQHSFQAMFGQKNGQPQIAVEANQGLQHILRRFGVQLRSRFIQNQDLGAEGQGRGDGHPLPLPAGEGVQRPRSQRSQIEQIQRLLDPDTHLLGR